MKFTGFKKRIGLILLVLTLFTCAGVWWGYAHLTSLVQDRLKTFVGSNVSVGNVSARWNRIELDQVRIARQGSGPLADRFTSDRIVIRPSLLSLFSGRLDISEIRIEKPYLLLEINPDGSFARLLPPRPPAQGGTSCPSAGTACLRTHQQRDHRPSGPAHRPQGCYRREQSPRALSPDTPAGHFILGWRPDHPGIGSADAGATGTQCQGRRAPVDHRRHHPQGSRQSPQTRSDRPEHHPLAPLFPQTGRSGCLGRQSLRHLLADHQQT